MAKWIRHWTPNPKIAGSSPAEDDQLSSIAFVAEWSKAIDSSLNFEKKNLKIVYILIFSIFTIFFHDIFHFDCQLSITYLSGPAVCNRDLYTDL